MAEAKWFIVHAYSNFEKKVAQAIREQAETQGLSELIEEIEVPTEEVVEVASDVAADADAATSDAAACGAARPGTSNVTVRTRACASNSACRISRASAARA